MRYFALLTAVCFASFLSACGQTVPMNQTGNVADMPYNSQRAQSPYLNAPAALPSAARRVERSGNATIGNLRPLPPVSTPAPTPQNCAAVCVIDPRTGNILFEHNARTRRQVASTQKIVTALCVCDEHQLDKMVTIQKSDCAAPPIRIGLQPGSRYRKADLLKAMLTGSFNDLAVCLARDTSGTVENFVERMNARARRMHMYDTHFANPNGLPANQYSTAHDMALAACYAYNNRVIRSFINIPEYDFVKSDGSIRHIRSTNKLLGKYPWVQGMKTGYTNAAGKCLISCGSNNGSAVIVVILGSSNAKIWNESLKYLKWALQVA